MKKLLLLGMTALFCFACNDSRTVTVTVTNPLAMERSNEMVEVSMETVTDRLGLADTAQIVVLNADGQQVPYQITYDGKVIFPAAIAAGGTATYTIQTGTPEAFDVKACGRCYPERMDDMAWENDLVAFRAYGPALQAKGERGFGYDLFTKYNTTEPMLEAMYAKELDKETLAKIAELKKTDPKAAAELSRERSYHIDHGYGMDCYAVGPTLGAGVAALMVNDTIIYPWCYKNQEILDNGPLRFTVKLEFTPDAVHEIAHMAVERKTGARGLRAIMESVMMDTMYEVPSDSNVGICTVTKDAVDGKEKPEVVYRDVTVPKKALAGRSRKESNGEIA